MALDWPVQVLSILLPFQRELNMHSGVPCLFSLPASAFYTLYLLGSVDNTKLTRLYIMCMHWTLGYDVTLAFTNARRPRHQVAFNEAEGNAKSLQPPVNNKFKTPSIISIAFETILLYSILNESWKILGNSLKLE